ncbi:MAG: hypothetical protein PHD73_12330 [Sediminibacterium sp.]|nr:hypothetical protein [Sediminibacterium sp.]
MKQATLSGRLDKSQSSPKWKALKAEIKKYISLNLIGGLGKDYSLHAN